MNTRHDPVLWLALGIPVLMIVLVAAGVILPRYFVKPPQYNFVYSVMANSNAPVAAGGFYAYQVNDKGIVERYVTAGGPEKTTAAPVDTRTLYMYDVASHTSKQLSFDNAQKLQLNSNHVSPDGYDVETGNSDAGFPFGGGEGPDQYMAKGSYSQRLNIAAMFGNTYYDFQFLGWVIK